MWNEDTFKSFPVNGANFKTLCQRLEICFFDRTAFIMALESFPQDVPAFLSSRRSGKSLAMSALAYFHGPEHLPDYRPFFEVNDYFCFFTDHIYLLEVFPRMLIELLLSFPVEPCHPRACDKQVCISGAERCLAV